MVKADWKSNKAWEVIRHIVDPELPFLTLEDLGVVRGITSESSGLLSIEITPTYIGCPGMMFRVIGGTIYLGGFCKGVCKRGPFCAAWIALCCCQVVLQETS